MKLAARKPAPSWVEERAVVCGYRVERLLSNHRGSELRYAARRADGASATLVTSARPFQDESDRPRFRRLARRRKDLRGPAFIPVWDIEDHPNHPVVVMAAYPARTLGELLEQEAPLAPERVMVLLAPVAEAIDLAHSSGVVHRTLGSDSLLLEGSDRLLLDSFGVVVPRDADPQALNQAGDIRYCPPEQLRAEPLEAAGNIYSLTAIIVHALTGKPPYHGAPPAIASSHLLDPPPLVSKRVPVLGVAVDAVIERGMAKDPRDRHHSAAELMHELFEALAFRVAPIPLTSKPRWVPPLASKRRPIARVLPAIAVAAVCGAVAAAAFEPFSAADDAPRAVPAAAAWNRLAAQRAELREELVAARSPRAQSAIAAELAAAYQSVSAVDQPARLASAARSASAAYADLAAAADAGAAREYDAASSAVAEAERKVTAASGNR